MTSDIDLLKAELAALRQELDDLRLEFPDALLEGDLATERVVFMNRLACQVFRCTPEQATTLSARDIFAPGDYERAQEETHQRIAQGFVDGGGRYARSQGQDLREFRMRRADGSIFPAETQSTFVVDPQGLPRRIRTLVRDITARKQLEAQLEETSLRDPLTGCYNRRYIERKRGELEGTDSQWACLLFDLTDFKSVNDTFGHDEGDRILRAFAHFLLRLHRAEDILVRLGGDEFALFIRSALDDEGRAVADRVIEAAGKGSPAAFNFGVAVRQDGESVEAVLARADQGLYTAKGRSLRRSESSGA